jgi:cell division transport system permease protein
MAHSGKRTNRRTSQAQLTTQFTTIVGMSLTLFLMALIGLGWLFGHHATVQLRQQVHVQVYLQRDLGANAVETARLAVASDPAVAAASYLDPEEAAAELEEELGESFVAFLGYVPLPPVIDVRILPAQAHAEALAEAAIRFDALPGVADVVWQGDLLSNIEATINRLTPPLIVVAFVCLMVAMALLNNTIRLTIFARRFLIRSMQLIGARPRLVRRPFLIQGLMLGLASGVFSFAGVVGLLAMLKPHVGALDPTFLAIAGGSLVGAGALLGTVFSGVAVNRYLRADLSQLH